jgi:nicotinamidase-related amidase
MAEQLSIEKGKTAVLIMDYQNRQLNAFSSEFQEGIIARANAVLDSARSAGVPVLYVEVQRGERTPETAINSAILPRFGEPVFTKSRVGPFSTTNLDETLKERGIDTLVLMGISTSGCVLSTVRWGADIDYKLIVVSDCCADGDEEVHRVLMEKLFPRQATVVDSGKIMRALGSG